MLPNKLVLTLVFFSRRWFHENVIPKLLQRTRRQLDTLDASPPRCTACNTMALAITNDVLYQTKLIQLTNSPLTNYWARYNQENLFLIY